MRITRILLIQTIGFADAENTDEARYMTGIVIIACWATFPENFKSAAMIHYRTEFRTLFVMQIFISNLEHKKYFGPYTVD
jgi:hypothetical protein